MSNKKDSSKEAPVLTLRNAAYNFAKASDVAREKKLDVLSFIKSLDLITPEQKEEVKQGFIQRYTELEAGKPLNFMISEGHYIPLQADQLAEAKKEKRELVQFTVAYVTDMNKFELGKLAKNDVERHAIVTEFRNRVTAYCRMKFAQLKEKAIRAASAKNSFYDRVALALEKFKKSLLVSRKNGDPTALKVDMAVYEKAELEFLAKLK